MLVLAGLAVGVSGLLASAGAAQGADRNRVVAATRTLGLWVGGGTLLRMAEPVGSVFVADPTIADVQTPGPSAVFVFGKKAGLTTLFVLARDGRPTLAETVSVSPPNTALSGGLEAAGRAATDVTATAGTVLGGRVGDAAAAANLVDEARQDGGGTVLDEMKVTAPQQVNLRVRVAEVSRSVSRTLGFNWSTLFNAGSFHIGLQTTTANPTGSGTATSTTATTGTGTTGTTSASSIATGAIDQVFGVVSSSVASGSLTLDAMADEGLVTLLAEPNLTTTSGQPATFLAGGEFPIPVPQGLGTVGIEFKQYGVSVGFTPTVLSSGLISMKISPEVSELSNTGAAVINGITVPALISRRAQTTIEMASGQSFAIAGLLQSNASNDVHKIPGLGDVPILGALFRSTYFQRDQTELVIVVTAYAVRPVDRVPDLPTDLVRQTTDVERLFLGRMLARRSGPPLDPERMPRLRGASGFMFE